MKYFYLSGVLQVPANNNKDYGPGEKMKKSKVALMGVGVAIGLALAGAGYATAATNTDGDLPPMVENLAEKFNLNKTEVAAYLETEREARQAEREAEFTKALEQAVTDGKITEVQKTALLAKHEELQAKKEALRGTSTGGKRTEMQKIKAEMDAFLKEQGIDEDILPQLGQKGEGMGRGQGRGMHREQ